MMPEWYCVNQGRQLGPIPESQLREMAATHVLRPGDLVWKQGYAQWVPAASVPGLFVQQPTWSAPTPAPGSYPPARNPEILNFADPSPRVARADDDYNFERSQQPSNRGKKSGAPVGLIVGLVAGGIVLVFLLVGGIILLAFQSSRPGNGSYRIEYLAPNPGPNPKASLMNHKQVWLNAGTTVTIRVISDFNTDVDCFLDDPNGQQVAQDVSTSKDCYITYRVQQTGHHTIVVDNLGTIPNKCTVTYSSAP